MNNTNVLNFNNDIFKNMAYLLVNLFNYNYDMVQYNYIADNLFISLEYDEFYLKEDNYKILHILDKDIKNNFNGVDSLYNLSKKYENKKYNYICYDNFFKNNQDIKTMSNYIFKLIKILKARIVIFGEYKIHYLKNYNADYLNNYIAHIYPIIYLCDYIVYLKTYTIKSIVNNYNLVYVELFGRSTNDYEIKKYILNNRLNNVTFIMNESIDRYTNIYNNIVGNILPIIIYYLLFIYIIILCIIILKFKQ